MSLDIGLNIMFASEPYGLGPGPPSSALINLELGFLSSMHFTEVLARANGVARKRFEPELGRLGRNMRQKLLYGFLQKEVTNDTSLAKSSFCTLPYVFPDDEMLPEYPNGCWEVGPMHFPQQL